MIVKTISGNLIRYMDCAGALIRPEIQKAGCPIDKYDIVYTFENGKSITYPLSQGDRVYYLNNEGKTIDKDFRMCCKEIKTD